MVAGPGQGGKSMILSAEEQEPRAELDAGICIIGAGAAGITLACEFDGSDFKVLLLEAGGLRPDAAASNDLYRGSAEPPHPNPSEFRRVIFGGTTGTWGGRCVPFDPIDFEKREYIADSGWPISYADVARHYPRAMSYCDAGAFEFSVAGSLQRRPDGSPRRPVPLPSVPGMVDDSVVLTDRIERYSLPTDFGRRYRNRIARSKNVTALLNARCVSLNREPGAERIESVTIADRSGNRSTVRSRVFILAVGGIEAVRLLMLSDSQGPGLGNHSDCLGRFYACHFENTLGRFIADGGEPAFGFERTLDGVYCRRKLQFSAEAQRDNRLLNSAFRLHFPPYSDAAHGSPALSAIYLAKSTLIREYQTILQHGSEAAVHSPPSAHLKNVVGGLPALGRFAYEWLFQRQLAKRKLPYTLVKNGDGSYPLEFNSEQTPQASNRIRLIDEIDRDGLKRVRVDWRIAEEDAQSAQRAFLLLRDVLHRRSSCRLEFDEDGLLAAIRRSIPLGGHHMGTARMAVSPNDGVVDSNCSVFGLPNLFIASSAVFRTNSHANPTLTIVALALRLAEFLKDTMAAAAIRDGGEIRPVRANAGFDAEL
jgi:choline dehydrogenase-like flavoprotein